MIKKLYFADINPKMVQAFKKHMGDLDFVEFYEGSILDLPVDAVVSPANSFGYMDGGIDLIYSQYFGWNVQRDLIEKIKALHHGELLVGMAEIVPTRAEKIPWLISAPTMRVPLTLEDTVNPYLAARAIFLLHMNGYVREKDMYNEPISNVIDTIAIPGLGTGVGKVSPDTCAFQIRQAINYTLLESHEYPDSWYKARAEHQNLYHQHLKR